MNMPVICNNCGNTFPSGFVFDNCRNVTLEGNKSQCPKCGNMADIPNGVFDFVDNTIRIISENYKTVEQLRKVYKVIEAIKMEDLSNEEINKKVTKEIPELNSIISSSSNISILFIIEMLNLVLQIYTTFVSDNDQTINITNNVIIEKKMSEDDIEKMTDTIINKIMNRTNENEIIQNSDIRKKEQKRNELCNCGSGKKYKRCCGNNIYI